VIVSAISRGLLALSLLFSAMIAVGMGFYNEDLYVAFCAGRDILEGRLGLPDTWSFTTGGEVWMDPGPLSNLLFYRSYLFWNDLGPVLIQVILLAACIALMYSRCRRLGASREASLTASTLGVLCIAPFLDIRDVNFGLFYFVLLTTLVAVPPPTSRLRLAAAVGVMVLWCNSHGTYVMGFGILGLKASAELLRAAGPVRRVWSRILRGEPDGPPGAASGEALPWLAAFAASLAAAALLNPYGPAYLLVPYVQLSSSTVTRFSADWFPIFHWPSLASISFFQPTDVRPFLAVVSATLITGLTALTRAARRGTLPGLLSRIVRTSKTDLVLETLVPLVLVALSFRLRRTILFAGAAMIPLIALSLRCWAAEAEEHRTRVSGESKTTGRCVFLVFGFALLLLTGSTFFLTTVPPYLPGNPTGPDKPLAARLMSSGNRPRGVVTFMNENSLPERVLAGWLISDYLLLKVPRVQVFMDCRDQSAYPDRVLRDYFSILRTNRSNPRSVRRTLDLLDAYGVEAVVLQANPIEFNLGMTLTASKKWACLYYDLNTLLLVRSDSRRFGPYLQEGRLPPLKYPDDKSRILSAAFLRYFMTGKISDKLISDLKRVNSETPHPNVYGLIYLSGRTARGCMKPTTKEYFFSEGKRVASIDPLTPHKGRNVLLSLIRILSLLAQDERACLPVRGPVPYEQLIDKVKLRLKQIEKVYLGYRVP
jgi:hypothetical protein